LKGPGRGGKTAGPSKHAVPWIFTVRELPVEKYLVVSVHDVAPCFRRQIEEIVALLESLGIGRASMLAVPDYHYRSPLKSDPSFAAWLRGLENRGFEIVHHGCAHIEEKKASGIEGRLHSRWSTRGEGEFLSLDYGEAMAKIRAGIDHFRECGFRPRGFVAPAWLLSEGALDAVRDAGFFYTNTGMHFMTLRPFRKVCAPAVVLYGGDNRTRRFLGVLETRARLGLLRWGRFARVAVHPVDMDIPLLKRAVSGLLSRAVRTREPITYIKMMELLGEPGTDASR